MNEKEIFEVNKVLEKFMGLDPYYDTRYGIMWPDPTRKGNPVVGGLHYHDDWKWLMLVVEKIEKITGANIAKVKVTIDGNICSIWNYWDVTEVLRTSTAGDDCFKIRKVSRIKIEAVYKAVYAFIQWYNKQKK